MKSTVSPISASISENVLCAWLRIGLVHGTACNFSARLPDGNVVLTPSSLPYETMTVDDLVVTDLDGGDAPWISGDVVAGNEVMHRELMRLLKLIRQLPRRQVLANVCQPLFHFP